MWGQAVFCDKHRVVSSHLHHYTMCVYVRTVCGNFVRQFLGNLGASNTRLNYFWSHPRFHIILTIDIAFLEYLATYLPGIKIAPHHYIFNDTRSKDYYYFLLLLLFLYKNIPLLLLFLCVMELFSSLFQPQEFIFVTYTSTCFVCSSTTFEEKKHSKRCIFKMHFCVYECRRYGFHAWQRRNYKDAFLCVIYVQHASSQWRCSHSSRESFINFVFYTVTEENLPEKSGNL